MKILTALFSLILAVPANAAYSLELKQGDFVKGEFRVTDQQALDLSIIFADQSSRRLLHNIAGQQEFMFTAPADGKALFRISRTDSELHSSDYRITILQHIPLEQQKALPTKEISPTIQRLLEQVQAQPDENERQKLFNAFWSQQEQTGTPLIEPSTQTAHNLVTFLWRGAKRNVILWGAPSSNHESLQRLADSDIWFKTFDLRNDALISYRFVPDVPQLPLDNMQQRRALLATLQADPHNPATYPEQAREYLDKFNYSSVLRLENAPLQPYRTIKRVPQGTLNSYRFHSKMLNNTRRIMIYLPAGFDPQAQEQLLLFFFDAKDYTTQVPTPRILDNMIAEHKIPPAIAIFIDHPSAEARHSELPPNTAFSDMLAQELYPWVIEQLHIHPSPKRTALIGSSFGGLASAYNAERYPQIFGNVLSMSGSFWWQFPQTPSEQKNYIAHLYADTPKHDIRFFLSAGRYETSNNGEFDILNNSRHLSDVLQAKGYTVTYREYTSGHDYLSWQGVLSDGLLSLFGEK